ncbi:MAG: DUF1592 domain-containing protein [Sandaracinus sp.]
MTPRTRWIAGASLVGALATGCLGEVDPGVSGPPGYGPITPTTCNADQVVPGGGGIRRLTPTEYARTVADLFPGVTLPSVTLAADTRVGGFDNNQSGQVVSSLLTEQHYRAAQSIGVAAAASLATWAPCTTNDAACAEQIVSTLGMRAQRRPLTTAQHDELVAWMETQRAVEGLEGAVAMLVHALLLTPEMLYRPEIGDPGRAAPHGTVALDGYEVASRLSYFLWRTMPDDTLFTAAAHGDLDTERGIEVETQRMLADPRARDTIADLHAQWFQTWRMASLDLDPATFPEFDAELRDDLHASFEHFVTDAFFEDRTLEALFGGSYGYVNDRTAPIFGVAPPGSSALVRVELDPAQRAGVLTQPGWLTLRDHRTQHSPIYRGAFVLEHVLCSPTGTPPPGADIVQAPPSGSMPHTSREAWEQSHTHRCASCHARIDGVGFGFENYDALGRWRDTDNGYPVDASGTVIAGGDADGAFDGPMGLVARLAPSEQVEACAIAHYYRYALGRTETSGDRCQLEALADRMARSGGDLPDLVVGMVTSPSFRFRTTEVSP